MPTSSYLHTLRSRSWQDRAPRPRARRRMTMGVPLYRATSEFFRTLAHPARIRVLELLGERDHAVHELLSALEIEQSNLSQQLAVLRRAGLVGQRRVAGAVVYSIRVPEVRDLLVAARHLLGRADPRADPELITPADRARPPGDGRSASLGIVALVAASLLDGTP